MEGHFVITIIDFLKQTAQACACSNQFFSMIVRVSGNSIHICYAITRNFCKGFPRKLSLAIEKPNKIVQLHTKRALQTSVSAWQAHLGSIELPFISFRSSQFSLMSLLATPLVADLKYLLSIHSDRI